MVNLMPREPQPQEDGCYDGWTSCVPWWSQGRTAHWKTFSSPPTVVAVWPERHWRSMRTPGWPPTEPSASGLGACRRYLQGQVRWAVAPLSGMRWRGQKETRSSL